MSAMGESAPKLADIEETPELRAFLEREYAAVADLTPDDPSRRRFLQLMGASLALAGVTSCRREVATILPESRRPPGHAPGTLRHFATTMDLGGAARGVVVTSFEGRPIKVDGNPSHPASRGGSDLFAQASILELYDPDRSSALVRRIDGQTTSPSWDEFSAFVRPRFAAHREQSGAGLAILSDASSSPTLAALRARLASELPQARWFEYEPLSRDSEREGARLAFGQPVRTRYAIDRARVVVTLDADLLRDHPESLRYAREFASRRNPAGEWMSRWYAVESALSATGAAADHRLPLASRHIQAFLLALEAAVRRRLGDGNATAPDGGFLREPSVRELIEAAAADLAGARGASLVVAGARQPAEVHALTHRLNAALGNHGPTVHFVADPDPERPSHSESLAALVNAMRAGQIETLLVLGGNPAYTAPADLDFAGALAKVRESLHLSLYEDETSRRCTWHLPQAHYLEAWGDARAWDGTESFVQPLIAPLYGGKTAIELVAMVLGESSPKAQSLVRRTFRERHPDALETGWRAALKEGVVAGSAAPAANPTLVSFAVTPIASAELVSPPGALEIVFLPDSRVHDGRFANNGWLQEQPDLVTKLTWDNAALVGPSTAGVFGLENEDVVELEVGGRSLRAPVLVVPGQAAGSIAIALGGGRTAAGRVGGLAGRAPIPGVDAYRVRASDALGFATGAALRKTGDRVALATTQHHYDIDAVGKRGEKVRLPELVRRGTLALYKEEPDFAQHVVHHPPLASLWKEPEYSGRRWGMAIDLNACIGCGACAVACQAENNVPVVGKDLVRRDREMHWLRIDRYFEGDPENPDVSLQPVACQHCETAPCESVCPVAATVHSSEGLNEQVYNRCVGTRYCANNCPYKVRRFNYFNYHKQLDDRRNEVLKLAHNPDVTVRSRGVMEKCTFCVQRIERVKIAAKNDKRPIADGEIQPACAQACPTRAIAFGDLNDEASAVRKAHEDPRAYGMLAELNTKPRNAYLARVRNPHPRLAKEQG